MLAAALGSLRACRAELPAPNPALDCARGALGEARDAGSAPGDGTVGVAREGGGISVSDVSSGAELGVTPPLGSGAGAGRAAAAAAGSVEAITPQLTPPSALGAPLGVVAGERASLARGALGGGMLGAGGRMLGGGGRRFVELGRALGGGGRILGGGGRERLRTGGGGGIADGREGGFARAGRGGSDTGRGGCAAGRCEASSGVVAGGTAAVGTAPAVAARSSLSLAVPCSSPMGSPRAAYSSA